MNEKPREWLSYALAGLDLRDRVILDAAIGLGRATRFWAEEIERQGGTSRIIGVDEDLAPRWREKIVARLGELSSYVELREADIFELGSLDDESIDVINCADTLVFLNPKPMRCLAAFREFRRVLRPGGELIVTSELPIPYPRTPEEEGEWRRWNLSKAVFALRGKNWSTEVGLDETIDALDLAGFHVREHREFGRKRNVEHCEEMLEEWREIMEEEIGATPWGELKATLKAAVEEVSRRIRADGFALAPGKFVVQGRKR